jgi:hypothetical protein
MHFDLTISLAYAASGLEPGHYRFKFYHQIMLMIMSILVVVVVIVLLQCMYIVDVLPSLIQINIPIMNEY